MNENQLLNVKDVEKLTKFKKSKAYSLMKDIREKCPLLNIPSGRITYGQYVRYIGQN